MKNAVMMQQVHGNNVVRVDSTYTGTTIPNCDAMITNDPNTILCVRVADCLPISVIDLKGRGIGLIHAGWRGLDNGTIGKTVNKMNSELQITNSELEIKIGPHICRNCYEVGKDVSDQFNDYRDAISNKNEKIYLDLAMVAEIQLIRLGIKKENIAIDKRCTFEDKTLFSYRRNKTDKRNLITLKMDSAK